MRAGRHEALCHTRVAVRDARRAFVAVAVTASSRTRKDASRTYVASFNAARPSISVRERPSHNESQKTPARREAQGRAGSASVRCLPYDVENERRIPNIAARTQELSTQGVA